MKSRTENVKLNLIYGYIAQICILILSFVGRKIFLNFLSVDYLGIHGLYSNILTVLSLAELGLDSAVAYSLYRPVAEGNYSLIGSMVTYFRKLYWIVSGGILVVGMALIPFLGVIVDSDMSSSEVIIYYVLFLVNTVVSYLGAHNLALLSAYQEQRFHKITTLIVNVAMQILHIVVLYLFRNYYIYVIVNIIGTLSTCIIVTVFARWRHSKVFQNNKRVDFDKKPIFERIKSTFLYKVGSVAVNNTTNILISTLISLAAVGLYSNYSTVIVSLQAFIATLSSPLISGIGNMCITEGAQKKRNMFRMLVWVFNIIAFVGFAGFFLLFDELIIYWLGAEYLLDHSIVFVIAFTFLVTNITTPVMIYREANGLFSEVKYLILIMAALNIVLSVVLGKWLGLIGILVANPLSRILTLVWYEPRILYKKVMQTGQGEYWLLLVKSAIIGALGTVASYEQCGVGSIYKQEKGSALLSLSRLTSDGRADRIHEITRALKGFREQR